LESVPLCGATRTAVRKALAARVKEGEVMVEVANGRDHAVSLRKAA
jgi:hypothetical protein